MILPRGKIYTNYEILHIQGFWMNITDDHWKDKLEYETWDMKIHKGLFSNWYNHTSAMLVGRFFEPYTENNTRQWIDTECEQSLLVGNGEI